MTPSQWKALPELVSRAHVIEIGIKADALDGLLYEVKDGKEIDTMPKGRIAFIRGLRGTPASLGWKCSRNGSGYKAIYKSTVTALLPREYR